MITESKAREISSYYQTPANGFSVFASTGVIPFGFLDEIQGEITARKGTADVELMDLYYYILVRHGDGDGDYSESDPREWEG